MDAKIFIIGHKPVDYGFWQNNLYQPIQVGNAEQFLPLRDNTGDNIAQWNEVFAENTAHYWVAHNTDYKYTGICQYRRRIYFDEDTDFDTLFENYYAIVPAPLFLSVDTVRQQYQMCHCKEDLDIVETIVKKLYPEYAEAWDNVINNGHLLFYSSSVMMRTQDFRDYVDFLYTVGCEWLRKKCLRTPDDVRRMVETDIKTGKRPYNNGGHEWQTVRYQTQVIGFLAERLLTFWLLKDNKPLMLIQYTKFEGV